MTFSKNLFSLLTYTRHLHILVWQKTMWNEFFLVQVALSSLGRRTMRVKIMAEREKSFVIEGRSGVFHNRARISQPEPCD